MLKDTRGRQFIAMHDVRGAIVTAGVSVSTGTATALISGDADYLLDIVQIGFSNNSTVAVGSINLINDGTTIRSFSVPASTTLLFSFDVPLKQQTKNTPWNVDMEDITGTTVTVETYLIKSL